MDDTPGYKGGDFYHQFAEISEEMEAEYDPTRIDWTGSPFEWLAPLAAKTKGTKFEELTKRALRRNGVWVEERYGEKKNKHDFRVAGIRVEVKTAFQTYSTKEENWQIVWSAIRATGYDRVLIFSVFPHHLRVVMYSQEQVKAKFGYTIKGQEYSDGFGACLGGFPGNEASRIIAEDSGDFEESFAKIVSFFRDQCSDVYLMAADGECFGDEDDDEGYDDGDDDEV